MLTQRKATNPLTEVWLIMDKQGIFDVVTKSIFWMIAGIVITVAILAFALIMSSYQNKLVEIPPELKAELLALRFLNTPECFTYQDSLTGRIFPGVIDLNKFTQERLDGCYRTEKEQGYKDYNFGIELEGYGPTKEGAGKILMTNNFFNKVDFTLYKEVFIRLGGEVMPTRMIIYVQTKI